MDAKQAMRDAIAVLEQNGYEVKISHGRRYFSRHGRELILTPKELARWSYVPEGPDTKGGLTGVIITYEGKRVGYGLAQCHRLDSYDKSKGATLAFWRAVRSRFDRQERVSMFSR